MKVHVTDSQDLGVRRMEHSMAAGCLYQLHTHWNPALTPANEIYKVQMHCFNPLLCLFLAVSWKLSIDSAVLGEPMVSCGNSVDFVSCV